MNEMILPIDVQILRLALNVVTARSLENGKSVVDKSILDAFSSLEKNISCHSSFRSLLTNCCYLHADVKDEKSPKIHLKFCDTTGTRTVYSETWFLGKEKTDNFQIKDFHHTDFSALKEVASTHITQGVTSLDLLNVVIPFTIADALCDTAFHEPYLAEHVEAFGARGKTQVLEFKEKFIGPQKLLEKAAYKLEDPFIVDIKEKKVTLGFECMIEKYLGKGTDYVYLDDELKVKKFDVVRYSGRYTD